MLFPALLYRLSFQKKAPLYGISVSYIISFRQLLSSLGRTFGCILHHPPVPQRKMTQGSWEAQDGTVHGYSAATICLICGLNVQSVLFLRAILEEDEFKDHCERDPVPNHLIVPSTKVENAKFAKRPWLASCYYRVGQ